MLPHKKYNLGIICLFSLINISLFGQTLSGTLLDKKTQETIPFATVQIGKDYGVVTNSEGDFTIEVSNYSSTDSLQFSSMGYRERTIAIKDYKPGKIYLTPQTEQLDAVFVQGGHLDAKQVMDSVNKYLEKNYNLPKTQFTVFRRNKNTIEPLKVNFKVKKAQNVISKKTVKRFNKTIDSLTKATQGNVSTRYSSFLGRAAMADSLKMRLEKATTLINRKKNVDMNDFSLEVLDKLAKNLDTKNTFHVRTGLFNLGDSIDMSKGFSKKDSLEIDSLLTKNIKNDLSRKLLAAGFKKDNTGGITISVGGEGESSIPVDFIKELDDYDYKIENISMLNDAYVYKISFKPHRNFFGNKGKYIGTLYVSTSNYAIVKEEFALAEGEHGQKFNMKFLLGFKFVENEKSGLVVFQRNENDYYTPKYIRLSGQSYAYLSRGFVLKENTKSKDRIKLKLDFKFEFDNGYQDEWLITDEKPISPEEFSVFEENEGIEVQELDHFDPKIWEGHNTLAPTKEVREYDGKD